jgi:hypothetical protein
MIDFDIFSLELSLVLISVSAALLASLLFTSRKIDVKCVDIQDCLQG